MNAIQCAISQQIKIMTAKTTNAKTSQNRNTTFLCVRVDGSPVRSSSVVNVLTKITPKRLGSPPINNKMADFSIHLTTENALARTTSPTCPNR